jgi:hypothetical protein
MNCIPFAKICAVDCVFVQQTMPTCELFPWDDDIICDIPLNSKWTNVSVEHFRMEIIFVG